MKTATIFSIIIHGVLVGLLLCIPVSTRKKIVFESVYKVVFLPHQPALSKKLKPVVKKKKFPQKRRPRPKPKQKKRKSEIRPLKPKKFQTPKSQPLIHSPEPEEAMPITETPESDFIPDQTLPALEKHEETPQSDYKEYADDAVSNKKLDISLNMDMNEFPFPWYLNGLKNKIDRNWNPMKLDILQGKNLRAVVGFRINRDGGVSKVDIEISSGVMLHDNSAVRAVYSSTPFPPLPEGYKHNHLDIHFEFEYYKR